jgi:hypothetical protein
VHNLEEMVCNVERHDNDDQYSNAELTKYKKMIEDSKKSLYHCCVAQYTRLFAMVKLFQLKASNGWNALQQIWRYMMHVFHHKLFKNHHRMSSMTI